MMSQALTRPVARIRFWTIDLMVPLLLTAVTVTILGFIAADFWLTVLVQVGIYSIAIMGLNVLVGYTGQISFGHNAFFGIGGYFSALATTSWGFSPIVGVLIASAASLVVALIVGYPTLRLHGHYLAMATFALGLGFYAFAVSSPFFGGFTGIAGVPPLSIGGFTAASLSSKYAIVWFLVLVASVATWRLRQWRFGRALRTVADDETAAQGLGIDCLRYKVIAFAISAVYVSVAGSLYAHSVSFVSPETFGFNTIILLFIMLFIGGLGSVWGSILGAFVGVAGPEFLGGFRELSPTIFAIALILILILRPVGLFAPLPPSNQQASMDKVKRLLKRRVEYRNKDDDHD